MVGLFLIAVGSGGIKPCVSAFGGDQFNPEQVGWTYPNTPQFFCAHSNFVVPRIVFVIMYNKNKTLASLKFILLPLKT